MYDKLNVKEFTTEFLQDVINRHGYDSAYLREDVKRECRRRHLKPQK